MANEQVFARLSVTRGSELTPKSRKFFANWLRGVAFDVERGQIDEWAARYSASVWTGRGIGWHRKAKGK